MPHYTLSPDGTTATIDLHGLTVFEAEEAMLDALNDLPKTTRTFEVTHGYHRGTALKRMAKNDFYHWRVADKRPTLNAGATLFLLK